MWVLGRTPVFTAGFEDGRDEQDREHKQFLEAGRGKESPKRNAALPTL